MEDEVQSYIVAMLEKADHVVVTEANGTKALRRYSKEGPFDLVLTDIEHKRHERHRPDARHSQEKPKAERRNHYGLARPAKTIQTEGTAEVHQTTGAAALVSFPRYILFQPSNRPYDIGKFVCYSRSIQLHPRPLA